MNQRLKDLRAVMLNKKWDAVIIPCTDPHMSEYIPERWKSLSWISGFTGSAGNGIVTADFAEVWTDSRYFIQAEEQMQNTEFSLMKLQVQHAPEYVKWISEKLPEGSTVGIVGSTMGINVFYLLKEMFAERKVQIDVVEDFWDTIWTDRPLVPAHRIYEHDLVYAGKSRADKIAEIRNEIQQKDCNAHVISTLDDIAWTLNLRGADIPCNPVFLSHLFIDLDQVALFTNLSCIQEDLKQKLENEGIKIFNYELLTPFIQKLNEDVVMLLDNRKTTVSLLKALPSTAKVVDDINPAIRLKAIKNSTEIENFKKTMEKDGVSLVKFFIWLDTVKGKETLTEQTIVDKVLEFRQIHAEFVEPSFSTIAGYKAHGALPHYSPIPESDFTLENDGLFLLDSGGQYFGGTTDITRVFSMGNITEEEKKDYTTVLKSLIALSVVRFPKGTSTISLDAIARKPIWDAGKHYMHGTGHGVGYFLNVHEGPQAFGTGANAVLNAKMEEGMVTTIEPGIYNRGRYGVRLENCIVTVPHSTQNDLNFLCFESITLCHFERELIDEALLSAEELNWLNKYHETVYIKLFPYLNEQESAWLREKTKMIHDHAKVEDSEYLIRG